MPTYTVCHNLVQHSIHVFCLCKTLLFGEYLKSWNPTTLVVTYVFEVSSGSNKASTSAMISSVLSSDSSVATKFSCHATYCDSSAVMNVSNVESFVRASSSLASSSSFSCRISARSVSTPYRASKAPISPSIACGYPCSCT